MPFPRVAALAILATLAPAQDKPEALPFSKVMSALSHNREFVEAFIDRLDRNPAAGGILGPEQIERLRKIIFGAEWEKLDRFPGITVNTMGRGVWLAAKTRKDSGTAAPQRTVPPAEQLAIPASGPLPAPDAHLKPLGFDLVWGDRVDPDLAPLHAASARLAELMNRLSVHGRDGYQVGTPWGAAGSPADLLAAFTRNGHAVEIRDTRYFANFGDLIYQGREVLTPFWIDTGWQTPGSRSSLLVPAGHSQHEVRVRGPLLHAAIAFYFGIDGKAEFRPIDTLDQSWVMGRVAHQYTGQSAVEVALLAGKIIRSYDEIHRAHPELPFGGYYALGVCNDVNAIIEQKMHGKTTLFPLTHDKALFVGQGEVERLVAALPVDGRGGPPPEFERVLGSMPVAELAQLPIPTLRSDLESARAAWLLGDLRPVRSMPWLLLIGLAAATAGAVYLFRSPRGSGA